VLSCNTNKNFVLGYSLPIGFLAGQITKKEDEIYFNTFRSIENCIRFLKKEDVSSIEIRYLTKNTPIELFFNACKEIIENKMELTIHGFLPEPNDLNSFKLIIQALRLLSYDYKTITYTLHAIKSLEKDNRLLTTETIQSLNKLVEKAYFLNLKIALEINRANEFNDPSYTYENLILIKNQVNNSKIGFCWDMGHSYWNVLNNSLPIIPPKEFLESIIHTHIHGLSENGQTHWPLKRDNLPLKEYLYQLSAIDYKGVYNLELGLKRWRMKMNIKNGISQSLNLLADLIAK